MPWSMNRSAPGRPISRPIAKQWTMRAVAWSWRGGASPVALWTIGCPQLSRRKKPPAGSTPPPAAATKSSGTPTWAKWVIAGGIIVGAAIVVDAVTSDDKNEASSF